MINQKVWEYEGIRVRSWKGQLESFKLESLKLKRPKRSWKEPSEVGKNRLKLASFAEVGKLE